MSVTPQKSDDQLLSKDSEDVLKQNPKKKAVKKKVSVDEIVGEEEKQCAASSPGDSLVEPTSKESKPSSLSSTPTGSSPVVASRTPSRTKVGNKKPKAPKKKRARKKKKMGREKMKEGDSIASGMFTWKISKLLGSGGFGDVYKVQKYNNADGDSKEYAMKTEMVEGDRRMLRLKIEVSVLKQCSELQDPEQRRHFVEFVDRGITQKFKFIVMGLVGPSLEDIRKSYLGKNYTKPTALNAAIQTLTAIADLHAAGWLHRDIKPQNFAVGLGEKEDVIFILDFGIAKTIFEQGTKEVKLPRSTVKFLGTIRFASRACHQNVEQGRKDDLETWLYMIYDLFDYYALPWKGSSDKKEVIAAKDKFFKHEYSKCYKIVPNGFKRICDYINKLSYSDEPDYKFIDTRLKTIGDFNRIDWRKKLDWIGKLKKKRKMKKESDSSSSDTSSDNRQSGSVEEESEKRGRNGKRPSAKRSAGKNKSAAKLTEESSEDIPQKKSNHKKHKKKKSAKIRTRTDESVEDVFKNNNNKSAEKKRKSKNKKKGNTKECSVD